jgi:hypothetical protein
MLSDSDKTDIRRHLKFPMYGDPATVATGWRYWQTYGLLEYRMNHFSVSEENLITTMYLPTINGMEREIFANVMENLDTEQAAVWKHNKNEIADKYKLYYSVCKALNRFIFATNEPTPLDEYLSHSWCV